MDRPGTLNKKFQKIFCSCGKQKSLKLFYVLWIDLGHSLKIPKKKKLYFIEWLGTLNKIIPKTFCSCRKQKPLKLFYILSTDLGHSLKIQKFSFFFLIFLYFYLETFFFFFFVETEIPKTFLCCLKKGILAHSGSLCKSSLDFLLYLQKRKFLIFFIFTLKHESLENVCLSGKGLAYSKSSVSLYLWNDFIFHHFTIIFPILN